MGAFADLTELIKETPGITDLIPQNYLDACKIPAFIHSCMTFSWSITSCCSKVQTTLPSGS